MSYRLIDSNAIAIKYPEVNEMPCVFANLPDGLNGQFIDAQSHLIPEIQNGIRATDANDVYSCGMRNGMRWCMSLIDGKEPLYENCPSAQLEERTEKHTETHGVCLDAISRKAAIDELPYLLDYDGLKGENGFVSKRLVRKMLKELPPVQSEKETPKRILWSGWKGYRDTRYKCPNCKKPVRNTDIYCHRCGQKLMFPNISFTPYVEGQKQELIVKWDDEQVKGEQNENN